MERVWFITGASRGFGRAFTEEAVKRGDKVIATVRRVPHDDIFKHPSIPLKCKALKGHIELGCVKGKCNDHRDRQI